MDSFELSSEQKRRYSRTIRLEEIGTEGQRKLLGAKVLIVGCGALGCISAMQLAASGVGHLHLVDFDTVDISNLQRQLAYGMEDIGRKKADILARKISAINPDVRVTVSDTVLKRDSAQCLIKDCDVVMECSDNAATKYMVTDVARESGIPCVLGGVREFTGQVQTFMPEGPTYRDWWPEEVRGEEMLPCGATGLLGPLPAMVASVQSAEVIKLITGIGRTLAGRLLLIDSVDMEIRTLEF